MYLKAITSRNLWVLALCSSLRDSSNTEASKSPFCPGCRWRGTSGGEPIPSRPGSDWANRSAPERRSAGSLYELDRKERNSAKQQSRTACCVMSLTKAPSQQLLFCSLPNYQMDITAPRLWDQRFICKRAAAQKVFTKLPRFSDRFPGFGWQTG